MNQREKVAEAIRKYEAAKVNAREVGVKSKEAFKRAQLAVDDAEKRRDMSTHELIRALWAAGKSRAVIDDLEYRINNEGDGIVVEKSDLIVV
jgi:uncharacterized membrane protein YebE (DUF533 family)